MAGDMESHGNVMEFHFFWSKYFVLFENWKHSCHRTKICPQKAAFSAFLCHGKFKLDIRWKSQEKVIEFYYPVSVRILYMYALNSTQQKCDNMNMFKLSLHFCQSCSKVCRMFNTNSTC